MSARKPTLDDATLFHAAMRDVKPLHRRRDEPAPVAKTKAAEESAPRKATDRRAVLPIKPAAAPPKPNPGIDRRTAERLRKGEIAIDRRLDLHGMTQEDAHAALDRFVRKAWTDGKRMLLVITGKGSITAGGGVLRRHLPQWLGVGEHAGRVLRIETAQPRHGGSGAFYVFLRRQRDGQ